MQASRVEGDVYGDNLVSACRGRVASMASMNKENITMFFTRTQDVRDLFATIFAKSGQLEMALPLSSMVII